jgi:hypothetical protein
MPLYLVGAQGQSSHMGPIRRTINLICALALTAISAFSFIYGIMAQTPQDF